MTQQFNRTCRLTLTSDTQALDLSEMQVSFEIHQHLTSVPNWARIRVYNLSRETQKKAYKEFHHIDLAVGYDGYASRLFYGQIRQFNAGLRIDAKSTFIDFICQDGDYASNWTVINKTLAKGWSYSNMFEKLNGAFAAQGLGIGHQGELPKQTFPRGRVLYGSAKHHMNRAVDNINAEWSIENGRVTVVPYEGTLPNQAIVLTPATGLIGLPQQTVNGITLRSLIDPKIQDGGLIQLNNDTIQTADINVAYNAVNYIPSFDPSGLYKVYSISHTGDTRGNDWHSDIVCTAVSATQPNTQKYVNTASTPNHG